ncbi:MAG TPA: hypothetical protein VF170_20200 [Planctomycetaceae bacterium]
MGNPQFLIWLGKSALFSAAGAISGCVGSWLVWNLLYGIGGRVVSDEQYARLLDDVPLWGAAAGACSGCAVGVLPKAWPLAAFALLHMVAVVNGAFEGSATDWRGGLAYYFGTHAVVTAGCVLFALMYAVRSLPTRKTTGLSPL